MGCILAELFTFRPLFPGSSEVDQLFKVCSVLGTPDKVRLCPFLHYEYKILMRKKQNYVFVRVFFFFQFPFTVQMQSEWPEGHRLATSIQFHFPECQKVELSAIITRASDSGLVLLEDFLRWEPEKRPTAQQALKYSFFQITKRPSDTVHLPLNTSHMSQTLNGRFSNLSFSSLDNDKLTNDLDFQRNFGNPSIYKANGIKQIILDNDKGNGVIDASDPYKSNKIENGIKFSVLNGGTINNPTLNNQQRLEQSSDTNRNVVQSNGYNNATTASLTSASLSSQLSQITQRKNLINSLQYDENAATTARLRSNDTMSSLNSHQQNIINDNNNNSKTFSDNNNNKSFGSDKPFNKFESENVGQSDSHLKSGNKLLQEKISDIFVNRNVGQVYNGGSIYNNKLYNGISDNSNIDEAIFSQFNDNGFRNKGFYLHDNTVNQGNKINAESAEAKVYNIFSKQKSNNSISMEKQMFDQGNSYLASKIPSANQAKPQQFVHKSTESLKDQKRGSFEDEELERILG